MDLPNKGGSCVCAAEAAWRLRPGGDGFSIIKRAGNGLPTARGFSEQGCKRAGNGLPTARGLSEQGRENGGKWIADSKGALRAGRETGGKWIADSKGPLRVGRPFESYRGSHLASSAGASTPATPEQGVQCCRLAPPEATPPPVRIQPAVASPTPVSHKGSRQGLTRQRRPLLCRVGAHVRG